MNTKELNNKSNNSNRNLIVGRCKYHSSSKHFPYSLFVTFISLIMAISSCSERIDIEVDSTFVRLAVAGNITPQEGEQYIRLTKSSDYFSNQPPIEVSGAIVTVDDGSSLIQFTEDSENPGYYNAPPDYVGIPGTTYHLSIELSEEINESINYEAFEEMPPLSDDIDSIVVEFDSRFEGWLVRLYAWDPPRTDFYMFNGIRNGVIITDSIYKVTVSDDRLFNGNYTSGVVVLFLDEEELQVGDTFTLVLSNITEEYANFLIGLQTEIQPHDPMFSGPPANVTTNVNNDAVGYFAAFPSAFTSTTVKMPDEQ